MNKRAIREETTASVSSSAVDVVSRKQTATSSIVLMLSADASFVSGNNGY